MEKRNRNKPGDVLITYELDAPREIVFKAWTDPEALKHWYAPNGCRVEFKKLEVFSGGSYHWCIHNPSFGECWSIGTFFEVTFPEKIVHSSIIADENGNVLKPVEAGMDADWPQETLITIAFEAIGNKTRIVLHQTVAEGVARRTGALPSWLQMFDRMKEFTLNRLAPKNQ